MKKRGNTPTAAASNKLADTVNLWSSDSTTSGVLINENSNCQSFSIRSHVRAPSHTPSSIAADESLNQLADTIKSLSIDSTAANVLKNENLNCQPFSMRGYVAEKRNTDPEVCIPFNGINENTWKQLRGSLDVPRFRWWRCRSCVREPVTSNTTAQDSLLELRVSGGTGSLKKNDTRPPAEAINMLDNVGEREIPYIFPLKLLARVATEMASDHPQLLETSQTSNAEKVSSCQRKTAGFGTDAIVEEGDKAWIVLTDVIDSEDQRECKKTRPLKNFMRVEEKASATKVVTTHTLQRTEERPSLSKGKNIHFELQGNGQELVRPQGSTKAKRSCPFLPDTEPISSKHAKATGSFSRPLLSRNRKKSNGGND